MAEMMAQQKQVSFGSVLEISKADWVDQVNKAGESVWVIVHVYTEGWVCSSLSSIILFIKTQHNMTIVYCSIDPRCTWNLIVIGIFYIRQGRKDLSIPWTGSILCSDIVMLCVWIQLILQNLNYKYTLCMYFQQI